MNIVNSIQRRENGYGWTYDYDIPLCRLTCFHDTIFRGISPVSNNPFYYQNAPVFACRFSTTPGYEQILALANEDGKIALQDTTVKGKYDTPLEGMQAHFNAIFDIAWMPDEMKLVTVSGDHTARLWDVNGWGTSGIPQIGCFHAHTRSVKTAVFRPQDKAVFATGARDGIIMIWDIRANHSDRPRPDNCIAYAHTGSFVQSCTNNAKRKTLLRTSRAQSITGLAFQDDNTLISCAAGDGMIKVWDLRKNYTTYKKEPIAKHVLNYAGSSAKNGFSSLLICPSGMTLYASCMDDVIYAYNTSSYNGTPVAEYYGHQNRTYYIKTCLSADGRYLASGSSDDHAYIWNINKPGIPLVRLSGHTEEVTCVDWCSVGEIKIITCSDDSFHRVWKVGYEYKIEDEENIRGRAESVFKSPNTKFANPGPSDESKANHRVKEINIPKVCPMKRNFSRMILESKCEGHKRRALSPVNENDEMAKKRAHVNDSSVRRLFNTNDEIVPSSSEDYDSDEPGTSRSTIVNNESAVSFSPTINLPNFVVDGTAPHLLQISPQKHKTNVDWLTKIQRERYAGRQAGEITSGKSCSPKNQITPIQRNARSRSHEPQKVTKVMKSPAISLFKFFKTVSKDCKNNSLPEDDIVPSTSIS